MQNTHRISRISFKKDLTAFCPLGQQEYTATVTVEVHPEGSIPDFCELDRQLDEVTGDLIIEEMVSKVYSVCAKAFGHAPLCVSADVPQGKHFPVTVTKGGFNG